MSTFTAFERAKISRFISTYGNSFIFKRKLLNDRGEPTNEYSENTITIDGVFHNARGAYAQEMFSDSGRNISKPQPMILCLQDYNSANIMPDDEVEIGSRLYSVVRLVAVGGYGYAWEISLELIDDGAAV